jgi:HEAT repeat protein
VTAPAERPTTRKTLASPVPAKPNDVAAKQSVRNTQPLEDAQEKPDEGREALIRELLEAKHGRREDILLEIARNRDAFLPLLRSLLRNGTDREKALVISLLTKVGDPESLPIFREMLAAETPPTQAKLIASLRIMEDHASAPAIRGAMDAATEDSVVSAAALALGVLGDDSDVGRGLQLAAERLPPYVQFAGAFLAAMQGDAGMREQAIGFLSVKDAKAQLYAVTMLPYLGGDDVRRALNRIQTDDVATWPSRIRAALLQIECDGLDTEEGHQRQ